MSRNASRPTVYFLGAGASVAAGVPLTKHLLRKVYERVHARGRPALLRKFIDRFGLRPSPGARPPIIDVMSLLDSCIRNGQPLDGFFTLENLREARSLLVLELSEVIEASHKGELIRMPTDARDQPGARRRKVPGYYRRFARILEPARARQETMLYDLPDGDTVITTNYDINLDCALYELAYWEESGGESGGSHITDVFLGSTFRDPYEDIDAFSDRHAVVKLFKLHGSLNWLYCPLCSRIYVAAFGFSVRYLDRKDKNELTCHCGFYGLEPVLIAPSVFQEIKNPHLQSIWSRSYFALEHAARWVFAGYSLPAEDLAVRTLLHRALAAQGYMGRSPEITVITRPENDNEVVRRYKDVLGKSISVDRRGFQSWVHSIQPQAKKDV